jgi:hypothetical protein
MYTETSQFLFNVEATPDRIVLECFAEDGSMEIMYSSQRLGFYACDGWVILAASFVA